MVKFTAKEEAFLKSNEVCRLATASKDGRPQVTPVIYALDGNGFVIAVDYGTKKLKNVRENPSVALVVDRLRPTRAVTIEGTCKVHERGAEYLTAPGTADGQVRVLQEEPVGGRRVADLPHNADKAVSWGLG